MRSKALSWVVPLLLQAVSAQPQPDVAGILKTVSETYKGVSQYELVLDQTLTPKGNQQPQSAHARVVFNAPNQYRMESTVSGSPTDDPIFDETVIVHNGSTMWFYLPRSNQYGSFPADKAAADRELSAHTPEATDHLAIEKYRDAAEYSAARSFFGRRRSSLRARKLPATSCQFQRKGEGLSLGGSRRRVITFCERSRRVKPRCIRL